LRFPFYNLRTWILAYLTLLIVAAMLLINVVMIKFSERDLVQARMNQARLLLHSLEQRIGEGIGTSLTLRGNVENSAFRRGIDELLKKGDLSGFLMINRNGRTVMDSGSWPQTQDGARLLAREALRTRGNTHEFYGNTWAVVWIAPRSFNVSAPVVHQGKLLGAITVGADLMPLYQNLRASEKIAVFYILLNTLILVLFGSYLLSRGVVNPLRKLLRIADEFKEGEDFSRLAESSRTEIGELSRSLNLMVQRLEENREELKAHIASLEKANQQIRKAQAEIIKSEKLASVGRLAAGVAHEIGNPIGIVLGYLEMLKGGEVEESERRDFLERIESELTRISQIIRQLLDFSRPSGSDWEETGIHDLLLETIDMVKAHRMMEDIRVEPSLEAEEDTVFADSNQLKQVFLNLIMNAADAMAEEAPPENADKLLTVESRNRDGRIEISFIDTGPGIDSTEMDRIFDPFYTTKDPGRGTGLGLSVCHTIVEGMGGDIRAQSTPGKGTTMIIDIPLYRSVNDDTS